MGSKYLKMADGFSSLFPKKVTVDLLHAVNGQKLGTYKLPSELIPENFNKPTILEIQNDQWQIVKAVCNREESYLRAKKLTLSVQEAATFVLGDRFIAPTRSKDLPGFSEHTMFDQFTLTLSNEDWQQEEFLSISQIEKIQEELKSIDAILLNCKDALLGFDQLHVRDKIDSHRLEIPFEKLCGLLAIQEMGNISLEGGGFVDDGFAIRSVNHTYYGLMNDGVITDLSLDQFEDVDEEFIEVLSKFNVAFVDWCNAKLLLNELPEGVNFEQAVTTEADLNADNSIL